MRARRLATKLGWSKPECCTHDAERGLYAFEIVVSDFFRILLRLIAIAFAAGAALLAFSDLGPMSRETAAVASAVAVFALLPLFFWRRRRFESDAASATDSHRRAAPKPRMTGGGSELATAMRSCKAAFIGVAIFSGVINVLMLSGAIYMLEIYDRVLPSRSLPTLIGLTILVAILYGGQGLLDFVRGRVLVRLGAAVTEALGARLYSSVLKLPQKTGHISGGLQPMRDLDSIRGFLAGSGPGALFDLPWLPLYLIVIFAFHFLLGVTALVGALLLVTLTFIAERLTRNPVRSASKAGNFRDTLVNGGYRNAEVVTAMGMVGRMTERWEEANSEFVDEQRKTSDIAGGFGAVSKVLRLMLQSAMLGVGAWLVIEQEATAGIIIAASILSSRALAPVDLAIANWRGFTTAREGWRRLNTILALLPAETERVPLPAPSRYVAVQSVAIAAPGTKRLLVEDATFAMEAGHALAVIGPSGSGKSTLVRALVGAWHPTAGRVQLDGADLDQWAPEERGRHIGYLPQDVELFAGTVAANIARFEREADPALVISAAKAAGVHDLIVSFRDGYETQIGEQGEALSAGQRQRIALARALYRDPFLVVLDEPNSNLDGEGEQALNNAILSVRESGGIVVLVAHRPSVLVTVDFVLAMDLGRIHAFGPKDEVFAKLFPRLHPAAVARGLKLATQDPPAAAAAAANS